MVDGWYAINPTQPNQTNQNYNSIMQGSICPIPLTRIGQKINF